jgi:hypothetical protein
VECKKAQPKEVMYAQQMAKGKAALQRGAYGDILSKQIRLISLINSSNISYSGAYVYGLNRSIPTTYAAPIYPFSPGMYTSFEKERQKNKIHLKPIFSVLSTSC